MSPLDEIAVENRLNSEGQQNCAQFCNFMFFSMFLTFFFNDFPAGPLTC